MNTSLQAFFHRNWEIVFQFTKHLPGQPCFYFQDHSVFSSHCPRGNRFSLFPKDFQIMIKMFPLNKNLHTTPPSHPQRSSAAAGVSTVAKGNSWTREEKWEGKIEKNHNNKRHSPPLVKARTEVALGERVLFSSFKE